MATPTPAATPRFNPFRPGSIVSPGMFSGRAVEIVAIEHAFFQTKNGNPTHFLIHGERGIGKSSLLYYLDMVARGEIGSVSCGDFKFLTVSIELDASNTYTDLVMKIGNELQRQIATLQPATELAKSVWDFLKRWEVMGVKYEADAKEIKPNELLDELTFTIENTLKRFGTELDGIVVLIDEADKAPLSANLGEFVKVFSERLTKRDCHNVCIGVAGISSVLNQLKRSHESSLRVFQIFNLEPLLPEERVHVLQAGLMSAQSKNGYEVGITSEAKNAISELSEGYPHFIQQFAYSAFDADADNLIDVNDVQVGASHPDKGALQQLGVKYFHELYFEQIGSDEYRAVLRGMADHFDAWVSKSQLRKLASIKESTLNNAIAALKKRHIIITKPGAAGIYRLPTRSFAVWIRALTKAKE